MRSRTESLHFAIMRAIESAKPAVNRPILYDDRERMARAVIDVLSEHLGGDTLRSEVRVERHYNTQTVRHSVPYPVYVPGPRTVWTPKEREFRLAMRRIHARGEKPTKGAIARELGWKKKVPTYHHGFGFRTTPYISLNGRQSSWQRAEYAELGYYMGPRGFWMHPRDVPVNLWDGVPEIKTEVRVEHR